MQKDEERRLAPSLWAGNEYSDCGQWRGRWDRGGKRSLGEYMLDRIQRTWKTSSVIFLEVSFSVVFYLFRISHRDLSNEWSDIDEEVEILKIFKSAHYFEKKGETHHIHSGNREGRIDDNSFTITRHNDKQFGSFILFGYQWWNICLEQPGTFSENQCKRKKRI